MMRAGFSFVELLIVIAILGILAALVLPRFTGAQDEAAIVATASNVRAITQQISIYHAQAGEYPAVIDAAWFVGSIKNPAGDQLDQSIGYDDQNNPNKWHTGSKGVPPSGLPPSWGGIYWYNPVNGAFRARVPQQATDQATLDLYNRVNNTNCTSLNQLSK